MSKLKFPLSAERWAYLKALQPHPPQMIWNSAKLGTYKKDPHAKRTQRGMPWVI